MYMSLIMTVGYLLSYFNITSIDPEAVYHRNRMQ